MTDNERSGPRQETAPMNPLTATVADPVAQVCDVAAVREWLEILHGSAPGLVHVCATDLWEGRVFTTGQLGEAAAYAASLDGREGVYARVTTINGQPERGKRGVAEDSLALPALWADLDIHGPGHKAKDLPPDEQAARAIVAESGLPQPSVWIHSGGGLYAIWLFDRAHVINGDLAALQTLSEDWQRVIGAAAARLGWGYGTEVSDLARVLRLPGTVNRKKGLARPCRIVETSGVRHKLSALYLAAGERLRVLAPATASTPTRRGKRSTAGVPENYRKFADSTPPQSAPAAENAISAKLSEVACWPKDAVGFRKVLMAAAFTLGGYVGSEYLDGAIARERLDEAVSEVWGSPDDDDLRWIEQGLRDGAAQPFPVYTEEQARAHSEAAVAVAAQGETPPEPAWSVFSVLGTEPFDPRGGTDQCLAKAVAARMVPALRYATDAGTWVVRERDVWQQQADDQAEWAISLLAELMPLGDPDLPTKKDDYTKENWTAARRNRFMNAASSSPIARKLRSILSGDHPSCLKITALDANPEILWAGGVPWDLRASGETPTQARVDPGTPHLRTALCAPDPRCPTPRWNAFLAAVLPDSAVRAWALRVLSVGLTGYPDAVLPVLYGRERSGKTSLVEILVEVLGSYAHAASPKLLSPQDNAHPEIYFDMKGRRLSFID